MREGGREPYESVLILWRVLLFDVLVHYPKFLKLVQLVVLWVEA